MKQYKSLDVAKFICAILIIIIHTSPFSSFSKALTFGFRNIVCVIAVPFFFLTSGFLAFKKIDSLAQENKNKYVAGYLKRLAIMYGIWSAVYFPFVVIKWTRKGFTIYSVLEYVKDFFFEGSYSTIWFLPALFTAVLLVYLLHKKLSYKTIFLISAIIYIFTLAGSSYYGLATKIPFIKGIFELYYSFFDSIKNGVLFGMIFVSLGALVSENEEIITKKTTAFKAFILVCFFAIILAIEEFLVAYFNFNMRGVDTVISLVPFGYFFIRFLLVFDVKVSDETCILMRKYSILMFLCQRIPLSIIEMFMGNTIIATNSIVFFFVVLITTLLISFVILKGSEKIKILKYAF